MDLKEYALLCAKTGAKLPYVILKQKYKNSHDFLRALGRHCLENYWTFQKVISSKNLEKASLQEKVLKLNGSNISKEAEESLMRGFQRFSDNYKRSKAKVAANLISDFGEIQTAIVYTFENNGELAEDLLKMRYLNNPDELLPCKEAEKAAHISHTLYYKTINKAIDSFAYTLFAKDPDEAEERISEIPEAVKTYNYNI